MMDPAIVQIISSALTIVAAAAPGVLAAATSHPTDAEAIASLLERVKALPVREGPGGTWTADLDARRAGGLASTEPPPSPYGDEP